MVNIWLTRGKQPIIQRFLKGMFKERPTFPRYTATHDVRLLLNFIENLSCYNETSLETCTKALATLISFPQNKFNVYRRTLQYFLYI